VYTTQIAIDGTHDVLKPGMSARVEILVDQLYDVKIVPVHVVANRGGKKLCYILTEKGPEEREVQTGAFNNTFVQIISGLEVGEKVLLNPPRVVQSTTESESKEWPPRESGQDKAPAGSTEKGATPVEKPAPETAPATAP
jgi:HlyD family secretion protein